MLVAKAPLRISFIGGGTDLPSFCRHHTGRVLSATIDKYVYVAVNTTPLVPGFKVKHREMHWAERIDGIEHPYVRAALQDVGFGRPGLEVSIMSDLPGSTGLGGSSAFSVAVMKAFHALHGRKLPRVESAEAGCRLEIDLLGEPIGKQDQYAAAVGGFNVFEFRTDGSVGIEPVYLHYKKRALLERWSLMFFTGIVRPASHVLREQQEGMADRMELYIQLAALVEPFHRALLAGDIHDLAKILDQGWHIKKQLTSKVTTPIIDALYEAGREAGAVAGKLLGAGTGGCLYFLAPPERHNDVSRALDATATRLGLNGFTPIPIRFVQSGADVVYSDYS